VVVVSAVATQLALVAVGYAYARRYDLRVPIRSPSRRDLAWIAGGTVAALATAIGASVVLSLVFGDQPVESVFGEAGAVDPTVLLIFAGLSILLVAPAEEFLFRGVVQGRLRRAFGPAAAVVLASALFGSIHLTNYTGPLLVVAGYLALLAVVGVVFGYVYERTGNLAVPVAVHAVYNTVLFGLSYLALVGL
jgi:hypothetical protein